MLLFLCKKDRVKIVGCVFVVQIQIQKKRKHLINKYLRFSESDPGAIQTHDLQNRNLTLYSLSYGAIFKRRQKYKKNRHSPNISTNLSSSPLN